MCLIFHEVQARETRAPLAQAATFRDMVELCARGIPFRFLSLASLSLWVLLSVSSCSDDPTPAEPDQPEEAPDALFEASRPLMGTIFSISVAAPESVARPAVRAALEEIERLEVVLSEWREDSEISRINRNAGVSPVNVSEEVFAVVKAGVDVSRWSSGGFDLSWAAMRGLYDFRPGMQRIPEQSEIQARVNLINYEDIELDEEARSVFLRRRGMAIGTGGIGKGYALDRAGEVLRNAGIESYLMSAGGQVQVHGTRGGREWRVGIMHPRQNETHFGFISSEGGSIATSGDYENVYFDAAGRRWHHILDPRSGRPVDRTMSVTFVGPTGLYTDALSTAAFVMGADRVSSLIEALPFEVTLVMVDRSCEVHVFGNAEPYVETTELSESLLPNCEEDAVRH